MASHTVYHATNHTPCNPNIATWYSIGPSSKPVCARQEYRHYTAYCHYCFFPYVPNNFTDTIAGNRHYRGTTLPYRKSAKVRTPFEQERAPKQSKISSHARTKTPKDRGLTRLTGRPSTDIYRLQPCQRIPGKPQCNRFRTLPTFLYLKLSAG